MAIDVLELQLVSALQRFSTLQRGATDGRDQSKLLSRSMTELESVLEELRVAQQQLIENRTRMEQMQLELSREREKYWRLFDEMPQAFMVTRTDTLITEANRSASELLNVSQRFLVGKTLSVFVCEDRTRFLLDAARVMSEARPVDMTLKVRPRERAPLLVKAKVTGDESGLRWLIQPALYPCFINAQWKVFLATPPNRSAHQQ
jgi:PAS domain S-box-containing protein